MNNIEWLLSEAGQRATTLARESLRDKHNILKIVKSLRKLVSAEQSAWAMELAQLQLKAQSKFHRADQMLFTRQGYEQSTSETLARYKAAGFPPGATVVDICCGIGGDSLGLAQRGPVLAVDAERVMSLIAAHNLALYRQFPVDVRQSSFPEFDLREWDYLHFDPDRRSHGRTILPDDFSPPLDIILREIGGRVAAIKLAPASRLPHDLRQRVHREWVGEQREAKQQIVWVNHPDKTPGFASATIVNSQTHHRLIFPNDVQFQPAPLATQISSFVFEPHATVLAGRLVNGLARQFGLARVGRGVAYLTADFLLQSPLLATFRVERTVPLQLERVQMAIRELKLGEIEWKKRAVEQETFEQLQKLKAKGDRKLTAIVSPSPSGPVVIFAERLRSTS